MRHSALFEQYSASGLGQTRFETHAIVSPTATATLVGPAGFDLLYVAHPASRGRHIRYLGSPYQTSMAEAGQEKALLVLDRYSGWEVVEEVPLDLGPRHHILHAPTGSELTELSSSLRQGDRPLRSQPAPQHLVTGRPQPSSTRRQNGQQRSL